VIDEKCNALLRLPLKHTPNSPNLIIILAIAHERGARTKGFHRPYAVEPTEESVSSAEALESYRTCVKVTRGLIQQGIYFLEVMIR